jgi:hypothetical protein
MCKYLTSIVVGMLLIVVSPIMLAGSESAKPFGPFKGDLGYQDIALGDLMWYVAFHGNRGTEITWVNAAWAARVAQLCRERQQEFFVQLRYVFEPLSKEERTTQREYVPDAWAMHVRGTYVPILVPYSSGGPIQAVVTPSKLAAVRCINDPSKIGDPTRAIRVDSSLDAARQLGINIP